MAFWVAVAAGYSSDVKNNIHEQQGQDMALWGTRKWWAYDDEQDYLIAVIIIKSKSLGQSGTKTAPFNMQTQNH